MIQQGTSIGRLGWTGFAIICATALTLPLSFTRGQSAGREASGPSAHDTVASKSPATQPSGDEDSASSALLNRTLPELQFDEVALSDVVDFLRDVSGANLFVNWKSLEAAGINKNAPVSVRLRNVKFSKAIEMVLDSVAGGQVRLAYFFDNNVLTIATADEAAKNTVTRVYDVKDLVSSGDKARTEQLIKAITNSCAPDTWKANGGSVGAISPVDTLLVVVQTEENQRLIKDLLVKTRKAKQEASGR